jgi:membrane protein
MDGADRKAVAGALRRFPRVLVRALRAYGEQRFGRRAQAIAYTVLFSLVSLLTAIAAVIGLFLRDEATRQRVTSQVVEALSANTGGSSLIQDLATNLAHSAPAVGTISILVAAWGVLDIFSVTRQALEDAWEPGRRSPFLQKRRTEAAMFGTALLLLIASATAGVLFSTMAGAEANWLGPHSGWPRLLAFADGIAVSLLLGFLGFVLAYRFVPSAGQSWHSAVAGAAFAGLAFELLKDSFSLIVARFWSANPVYGALTSVFVFLLWCNFAGMIVLIGAEITVTWERTDGGRDLEPLRVRARRLMRDLLAEMQRYVRSKLP